MADGGRLEGLLKDVLVELSAVEFDSPESGDDAALIELLRVGAAVERAAQRVGVQAVAALQRRGVFAQLGQRPVTALADLLGIEHVEARRVVTAAEQVVPRTDLQGQVLPARLPATADAFAAGHGQRAARRSHRPADGRGGRDPAVPRDPGERGAAARRAGRQLHPDRAARLGHPAAHLLDQDGARPDDRDPREGNELRLTRDPHGGGWLKGRFTDAAMYDQIAALIDAKSAPLTADDRRPLEQRQAEAMAEIFGWVAAHGDTTVAPTTGGRRPQVNVLIRLEDLQNRAHAACLDFAGTLHPAELRRLCCDAGSHPHRAAAGPGSRWTWGARPAPSRTGCAARSPPATAAAPTPAAPAHRPGAKSTISANGNSAGIRRYRTW